MRALAFIAITAGLLVACVANVEPNRDPDPANPVQMSVAGEETSRAPTSEAAGEIVSDTSCALCCGKAGYGYYYYFFGWGDLKYHCTCGNANDWTGNPPYTCW